MCATPPHGTGKPGVHVLSTCTVGCCVRLPCTAAARLVMTRSAAPRATARLMRATRGTADTHSVTVCSATARLAVTRMMAARDGLGNTCNKLPHQHRLPHHRLQRVQQIARAHNIIAVQPRNSVKRPIPFLMLAWLVSNHIMAHGRGFGWKMLLGRPQLRIKCCSSHRNK